MNTATSGVARQRATMSLNLLDALKRALQGGEPNQGWVPRRDLRSSYPEHRCLKVADAFERRVFLLPNEYGHDHYVL